MNNARLKHIFAGFMHTKLRNFYEYYYFLSYTFFFYYYIYIILLNLFLFNKKRVLILKNKNDFLRKQNDKIPQISNYGLIYDCILWFFYQIWGRFEVG